MILYVNGDSHSAGAEAVNNFCFAEDDSKFRHLAKQPHPHNLAVSYGKQIADSLGFELICDAESASSNARIIRTSKHFLQANRPDFVLIGWATWEREEWYHNNVYYQVTAGGGDLVPSDLQTNYKEWVIETEHNYARNELVQHQAIYQFHKELAQQQIPHLFFNTFSYFGHICLNQLDRYDWSNCYLEPYDENYTYYHWLKQQGIDTVSADSYHFGKHAHTKWAEFLLPRLTSLL